MRLTPYLTSKHGHVSDNHVPLQQYILYPINSCPDCQRHAFQHCMPWTKYIVVIKTTLLLSGFL